MKFSLSSALLLAGAVVGLSVAAPTVRAQDASDYPNRDIRMIVPFPAGGGTDLVARVLADALSAELGAAVYVDNIEGAAGAIGAAVAAAAEPDGYTILISAPGALTIAPHATKDLSYEPQKSFEFVSMLTDAPMMLAAPANSPFNTTAELIEAAKAGEGAVSFASSGTGGNQHLNVVHLGNLAGVQFLHVPYQGGAPALLALVGGQVDAQIANYATIKGQIEGKELKLLATTAASRLSIFPDLPTVAETVPGFDARNWVGALVPAGVDQAIVAKIDAAFAEALKDETVLKRLADVGWDPYYMPPAEFRAAVATESALFHDVLEEAGLLP